FRQPAGVCGEVWRSEQYAVHRHFIFDGWRHIPTVRATGFDRRVNEWELYASARAAADRGQPGKGREGLQRSLRGDGILWLSATRSGCALSRLAGRDQSNKRSAWNGHRIREFD